MATTWTYAGTRRGYTNLWATIEVKGGADARNADRFAQKIVAAEDRYRRVETETGVPWFFIGALHMRESGCDFAGVLHNGDRIIGTRKKTYRVPKGRGPFPTWEAAAVDALQLKGLHQIGDWPPARIGYEAERFNGLGFVGKAVNSAYLWAGSNHEQLGKYVADHKWDKDFDDPQIGVMTVLKRLCEMRSDIARKMDVPREAAQPIDPVEAHLMAANLQAPMKDSDIGKVSVIGGGTVTVAGIGASIWNALKDAPEGLVNLLIGFAGQPSFWIALGTVGVCAYIYAKRKGMRLVP